MSQVFSNPPLTSRKALKPLSGEQLQKIVVYEVEQAVDFIESQISPARQRAEIYYQGGTALKSVPGRSKVVVTKVRDAIRSVIPSIARIFTQTDTIAEFTSDDEEDLKIVKDATLFCNSVFWRYGGYRALIEATTDALKARIGVVRVSFERKEVAQHQDTQSLTQEQLDGIEQNDPDIAVTEVSEPIPSFDPAVPPLMQAVLTRSIKRDCWTIECMKPEEFIIDSDATGIEDARMYGFRRMVRIYQLTEQGVDYGTIVESGIDDDSSVLTGEDLARRGFTVAGDADDAPDDPTSKEVLFCEIWLRIDADGDGIPELRHIMTVGTKMTLIMDEPAQYSPLAIFRTDMAPHVFFPISLAEDLQQDQDAMTGLLRSILDNTALVNSPRTEVNDQMVNLDDVKNNEIGAIIRVRAMGSVNELVTPFVAGQTLPVLQVLNEFSEARSGVTKLSQGVDADALQSTSRIAANAITQGADARIEMMARNIGESGVKEMFMAILRCAIHDKKGSASIRDQQGYREVDTSQWHDQMSIGVNVGLGNGQIDEKKAVLGMVSQVQTQAIGQYGLSNPLSGYVQLRNTFKQLLRLSGIQNLNDYFPYVDPQILAQLDKSKADAAQAQAQQPDPTQGLVEAEKIKGQVKMQTDAAKLQQESQLKVVELRQKGQLEQQHLQTKTAADMEKQRMLDDRERDKQAADFAIQSQKVHLDDATKRAVGLEQAKNRGISGQ